MNEGVLLIVVVLAIGLGVIAQRVARLEESLRLMADSLDKISGHLRRQHEDRH